MTVTYARNEGISALPQCIHVCAMIEKKVKQFVHLLQRYAYLRRRKMKKMNEMRKQRYPEHQLPT